MSPRRLSMLLGGLEWRCLGPATVRGEIFDVGPYPGLRLARDGRRAGGYLLEVRPAQQALRLLDDYEGVDLGLYARRRCRVQLANGEGRSAAWVYEYNRPVGGLRRLSHWPLFAGKEPMPW